MPQALSSVSHDSNFSYGVIFQLLEFYILSYISLFSTWFLPTATCFQSYPPPFWLLNILAMSSANLWFNIFTCEYWMQEEFILQVKEGSGCPESCHRGSLASLNLLVHSPSFERNHQDDWLLIGVWIGFWTHYSTVGLCGLNLRTTVYQLWVALVARWARDSFARLCTAASTERFLVCEHATTAAATCLFFLWFCGITTGTDSLTQPFFFYFHVFLHKNLKMC